MAIAISKIKMNDVKLWNKKEMAEVTLTFMNLIVPFSGQENGGRKFSTSWGASLVILEY